MMPGTDKERSSGSSSSTSLKTSGRRLRPLLPLLWFFARYTEALFETEVVLMDSLTLPFISPHRLIESSFTLQDAVVTLLCCAAVLFSYLIFDYFLETVRSKAWVVMFIASSVLSLCGTYYVFRTLYFNLWTIEHIYSEDLITRSIMIFFLSSNIMDLVIGVYLYPKYLDPFSTIAHHIFYIIFITILLAHHYSSGFMLCFFMEIPTCLLAIGTIWETARSDIFFGISFFLTRILYNLYLAYRLYLLSPHGLIWKVCVAVLGLHLFWFSKWIKTYGRKAMQSFLSKKDRELQDTITFDKESQSVDE